MVSEMPGILAQVQLAQTLHQRHGPGGQALVQLRHVQAQNLELGFLRGVIDEDVEAATAQGLGEFARVVAGEHDGGAMARADGAQLRHTDLELAQHLQQEGLELGIGAVDLVDQQPAPARRW